MTTVPRWTLMWLTIAAFTCLSCGADAPAPPQKEPTPAVTKSLVHETKALPRAVLPDGVVIKLELAISQEEISQGLMFRPSLAADRGMLFLFEEERLPSFWMKNTLIALDIVFLDALGLVVDITRDAQPCKAEPCPQYLSKAPALAVLELAAGSAHGLDVGARIEFRRVPDYPKPKQE
jgi:uncharacterized membrane protein (UPF0127 family)